MWGVGDVVHARQRLVQLGDLILIVRFLLGRRFQIHSTCFSTEGVETGPGDVTVLEKLLGLLQDSPDVPGDEVHIAAEEACFGTGHSECIVTEYLRNAEKFQREVDAAAVYVNASTRFTDGFEFGPLIRSL